MDGIFKNLRDIIDRQINFDNVNVNFEKDKKDSLKIHIQGLGLRNPILKSILQSSIISNISKQMPKEKIEKLYTLYKRGEKDKRVKEEFEEKFHKSVIEGLLKQLKDKLNSKDMPTPIFPTSVAYSEIPNYYISDPWECYTLTTKLELLNKQTNSICGRCGERTYGLYVPEEGFEIKEMLRSHVSDFYNINIRSIAGVERINPREIEPFEYLFYLLDRILQEMYRKNAVPNYHIELFVVEGVGQRKKFFSHYIIPNLNEIFYKLYHGDEKYSSQGRSKIKALISSLLVENWDIDNDVKRNNSKRAHAQINRFLYHLFYHKTAHIDSILFLEDLKISLKDTKPIWFIDEVISWI